jgi:hypothetical protein
VIRVGFLVARIGILVVIHGGGGLGEREQEVTRSRASHRGHTASASRLHGLGPNWCLFTIEQVSN